MAGDTSCSRAVNATARRGSSMLGITMTASGFSGAANVLASPISPPWATGGIARRVGSKSYAPGFNGALTVPCLSSREGCTSGRISAFWRCWPTTRLCESRVRATLANTVQISTALICGGSVEAGLQCSVDGQSANLGFCPVIRELGLARSAAERPSWSIRKVR